MLLIGLSSCENASPENSDVVQDSSIENTSTFQTVSLEGVCEIKVPGYFEHMNDINADALIQYGYIEPENDESIIIEDEIYAIVLVDYKDELQKMFGDSLEINILDFNDMCVQNLDMTLDDLSVEYDKPNIQDYNGVLSIHNEFYGRLGQYLVYYQFGIYETEIGFYQILTWCMQDHVAKHKEEMYKITSSFREI